METQLLVMGGGPAGYPAAFHAADLGMAVTLVDLEANPGGVCLYRGCIPSKALLHVAQIICAARESSVLGVNFDAPRLDMDRIRAWKQGVVDRLTAGLGGLTRQRGIRYLQGRARLTGPTTAVIETPGGVTEIRFAHAIIATGSAPVRPPVVPELPGVWDSTEALRLPSVPGRMLVMGGGYIGLELGQVYAAFGTKVSIVEMKADLLPGVDADLVKPLAETVRKQCENVWLGTRVTGIRGAGSRVRAAMAADDGQAFEEEFDRVLVAVGRVPVTAGLGLENTRVQVSPQGFIQVDEQRRTAEPTLFAIGDVAGQPMLAHKATHEGRACAEAIHGGRAVYAPRAVPAVVFSDPEIAWCGMMEDDARRAGLDVRTGVFPWQASGRAATLDRPDGLTKVVTRAGTGEILGVGIAGHGAGELIGEGALAMEMGAVAEDLALTIHAHPSLSETIMEAAERVLGSSTHFFQRM